MINPKVFKPRGKNLTKIGDLHDFSLETSADDRFLSDDFADHVAPYCLAEPFHLELLLDFGLHKPETPDKKKKTGKNET